MKKLLFTAAIAVLGFTSVNAQEDSSSKGGFEKGDVFISGSVGFGSESQADDKTNGFTIAPRVGFFVSENIAVGAQLSYGSFTDETKVADTTIEDKDTTFGAGVFGRYYFTPDSQFSIFGELAAGISSTKNEQTGVDVDAKSNGFNIGIAPGISYFVSNNIALEASFGVLGYSSDKADFDGAEARNNFNFGVNLSDINFGIIYKF
ncbi:outer membrane beta-barrel protein [uncultured Lacinutrix sp.]|uniref:outer membrane beta-barrel protein n=1 Tax=uncultured Lacinutrix sp. TaxID=574032 RepID=UPI0026243277|nr:outer membrane beta-barrel protein [uncultured Lacinutrix sp.]